MANEKYYVIPVLLLAILVLFTVDIYGQELPSVTSIHFDSEVRNKSYAQTPNMQSTYWKRHQIFKTLGWTSLLAGVGGVGYGLFSDMSQDKAIGVLIGGSCLVLVSVPMFGLAHSNKQKARSLSLQGQNLASPLPNGSVSYRPGLSLCLNF